MTFFFHFVRLRMAVWSSVQTVTLMLRKWLVQPRVRGVWQAKSSASWQNGGWNCPWVCWSWLTRLFFHEIKIASGATEFLQLQNIFQFLSFLEILHWLADVSTNRINAGPYLEHILALSSVVYCSECISPFLYAFFFFLSSRNSLFSGSLWIRPLN